MALSRRPHLLLAGGGTGGHVFPALAVADEMRRRGWSVSFAGSPQGLEARLAPEHGLAFHPLAAKPMLGRGPLDRARALAVLIRSSFAARALVRELGAAAVLGTGGYASAAGALGGWLARRPVLLLEPNAASGGANRQLSRVAREALLAFDATARELKCPTTTTGVPVRAAFFGVPALAAVSDHPHLLVLGGSQGAKQLNELVPKAVAPLLEQLPGLTVRHQCGRAHLHAAHAAYSNAGCDLARVEITAFIDDVAGAMARADLVLSRAGAITVAEIAAAGRPAIFVPLSIAGGHQIPNAAALAEAGAASLVRPEEASVETLRSHLAELLPDRAALVEMGRRARGFARPNAVAEIAGRIEHHAGITGVGLTSSESVSLESEGAP